MNLKNNEAITLVALIISIIILLILAGVSLSMVLGDNGLINKAQSSVNKYQESAVNEQIFLNDMENYLDLIKTADIESYIGMNIKVGETGIPELIISGNCVSKSFESSDTNIATVDVLTGEVTGVNVGSTTISVTIIDNIGQKTSKSCEVTIYEVGSIIKLRDTEFYVIKDNGDTVTLLSKTIIGGATWENAKTQASTFGSDFDGDGRLMEIAEARELSSSICAVGTAYWLADWYDSSHAWGVYGNGQLAELNIDSLAVAYVRPVVEISKSKL